MVKPEVTSRFRDIVEAHQARVYSIAYRIAGDSGTAEEIAQDVFLELYRTTGSFTSDEHMRAWLTRVAVHRATDAVRRRPRALHNAAEFEDWMGQAPARDQIGGESWDMERLLLSLPPVQRAIVLLRYQEDLEPVEIAAVIGMPLATVKSHLQRSLKLLRSKAERMQKAGVRHG